jgi:AcrR family transcriptional regulator
MAQSLREEKKRQVRERIVEAASTLLKAKGLEGFSANDIAVKAGVGRATFFRYFESKEAALVVGFYEDQLTATVKTLALAPAELGPMDTLIWLFQMLEEGQGPDEMQIIKQGTVLRSFPSLRAKALEFQIGYEAAVSQAIAHRFSESYKGDPRPGLLAAAVLAMVRSVVDQWIDQGATDSLQDRLQDALELMKTGFPA